MRRRNLAIALSFLLLTTTSGPLLARSPEPAPPISGVVRHLEIPVANVLVILYNLRTRALHRHAPYLDLWEWLLWTGLSLFGLLITASIFAFEFIVVLVIFTIGMSVMLWIRFLRFPPILNAYEVRLAKQRYYTKTKFSRPETTIRPKTARRAKRRR